ncbi:LysR family transcriptional regulator [Amycolatopsis vastitatis]|uniref:LysR family transcriptional regulator n=1 Tax=Amycolatopsis vastitatis TaxID=1905142 RepID=A0A229SZ52_9PSEU|nr:LysR family transcriptional regulator [Amycolatopsis vastitatis]OXM64063.1 LysR family transcriptional regulator [Amycolatopsis vastitatis]
MNLARLDLNLLVALDALLQERSVTRAAERMGLGQPAVSAQLGRLRRHFHDDLLTRAGNQYRLTPLAVQLKERVRVALSGAERVFAAEPDFDPASSTREFSMLMSDYGIAVLGPGIAARLADEAPGTRLRFPANTPKMVDAAVHELVHTDLLVIPHGFVDDLPHADLYRDEWVCLVAAGNTDVGESLTVGQLETMPWVVTYHGPTASTPAARQMRMLGIEPHVQVVTETFLTVPGLVAGTNRVALLQRRLADGIPDALGVRALPCPFEATPLVEAMWWHPMYEADPEHRYLRDVVARTVAAVIGIDGVDAPLRQK